MSLTDLLVGIGVSVFFAIAGDLAKTLAPAPEPQALVRPLEVQPFYPRPENAE
jgi:hypothetical protein